MLWPQEHPRTFCSGVVRRGGGLAGWGSFAVFYGKETQRTGGGLEWKEQELEAGAQLFSSGGDRSTVPCLALARSGRRGMEGEEGGLRRED